MKVFVYGTLKKGYGNHRLLAASKFIDVAATYENYLLYDGGFPYAVNQENCNEEDNTLPVLGEVYEVDRATLAALDQLEGEGDFYYRHSRPVFLRVGGLVQAFIYEYPTKLPYKLCPIVDIAEENYYKWGAASLSTGD